MPLYSCPHFNLTITALPFKPCKNGLGLVTPIFLSFLRAGGGGWKYRLKLCGKRAPLRCVVSNAIQRKLPWCAEGRHITEKTAIFPLHFSSKKVCISCFLFRFSKLCCSAPAQGNALTDVPLRSQMPTPPIYDATWYRRRGGEICF